jgi:murein L,D-transpeptidase YafK
MTAYRTAKALCLSLGLGMILAGCDEEGYSRSTRHLAPIPPATTAAMATKGMNASDPILIRSYKKESELEVWKKGRDGQYAILKTYPICRWSGQLGPKTREGDRQAPEGFYQVGPAQLNPNSSYYLSFDTGYPNAFDRSHGRSGSHLMVHGSCSSRGCFAMTDETIKEVYALAREALNGGQRSFQFQSYPFRMTAQNLARHRYNPHMPFWRNLKEGSDHFEVAKIEPRVSTCRGRYTFNAAEECTSGSSDPALAESVASKSRADEQEVAALIAKGTPAVKLVYEDGGQHTSFRDMVASSDGERPLLASRSTRRSLGDISRPDALAAGPREIVIDSSGKPVTTPVTALAFASASPQSPALAVDSTATLRETPSLVSASTSSPAPPSSSPSLAQRLTGGIGLIGAVFDKSPVQAQDQTAPSRNNIPGDLASGDLAAAMPEEAPSLPPVRPDFTQSAASREPLAKRTSSLPTLQNTPKSIWISSGR